MGIIKSTVLNEKKGVITEERFQKLTTVQWFFHYLEVVKFTNERREREEKVIEYILNSLELLGFMINPKMGRELQEYKNLQQAKKEINADSFDKYWEKLKEEIPKVVTIDREKKEKDKYILPVFKRDKKPGIVIKGGGKNGTS